MIYFFIGLIMGIFLIPIIKEVEFYLKFENWIKEIVSLEFIKDVLMRTFKGEI